MKKSIFGGILTFFILLMVLFVGMFLGNEFDFFQGTERKIEYIVTERGEKEKKEEYEPILEHERAVIGVVEENIPAVVNIVASKYVEYVEFPFSDFFFFPQEPEVKERLQTEQGTGFIISEDGLILTNKHVVEDKDANYTLFLSTGEKFEGKVLARDPMQDLAVLKIEGNNFPSVSIGDSESVRVGQTAIAIGNALGEFQDTVSVGVISGIGRRVVARGRMTAEVLDDVLQTDAAINFGNSGGPLLNLEGQVIGINTATAMHAEGIGFAIPINSARRAIDGAKKDGRIVYPFLGISYVIVDREMKERENLEVDYGALIVSGERQTPAVRPGSAADKAGLRSGDIILEFENEKITTQNSLARIIAKYDPKDEIKMKVLRNGEEIIINAVLGEIE